MKLQCPHCQHDNNLPISSVPPGGLQIQCQKCYANLIIDEQGQVSLEGNAPDSGLEADLFQSSDNAIGYDLDEFDLPDFDTTNLEAETTIVSMKGSSPATTPSRTGSS
ncbi:MAG: hypothetical protein AAGJ35_07040, partial [Myxococcota bacterium]